MIEIKNLSFRYDKKFYALFNIALTIYDNQKILMSCEQELETQTLFRILSKQEKDYSGDIYFDNKNLKEIKTANLDVCYITKTPYLLKNKSVLYNIAYPLIIRKENKNNSLKIAEKLLKKYNLIQLKNKKIKKLTKNEQISIILLRCAIRNPKYIFCDDIDFDQNNFELFINISKNSTILFAKNNYNNNTLIASFQTNTINSQNIKNFTQFYNIKFVGGSIEL